MSSRRTYLKVDYKRLQREAAAAWIGERMPHVGQPAFEVIQTIRDVHFRKAQTPANELPQGFAGRVFGPGAELRWLQDGGELELWFLREEQGERSEEVEAHCSKYYCLGFWQNGAFLEPRLMRAPEYPVDDPKEDERVYVKVVEYSPCYAKPTSPKELARTLNQPVVLASRYVGVGCGYDSPPG